MYVYEHINMDVVVVVVRMGVGQKEIKGEGER